MDPYKLFLLLFGLVLLAAAWLPQLLKRQKITFPMAFVAAGIALYLVPLPLARADPLRYPLLAEFLAELAVLVALVGVGLRIDTRFSWRRWSLTWRLLAITMPLTMLAGFLLGKHLLGYGFAAAALWRVASLVVVISIVLHGFSARPVLSWLDRWRTS